MTGFLDAGFGDSGGVDTGDIGHSLRLRGAASAYLSRVFGAPTNAYGWCYSGFVKLGSLTGRHILLNSFVDSLNRGYLEINESGIIRYDDFYGGSQRCLKVSTQVLRDPTSWYHIFVLCNTDNATAEDRLQIWVNGVRITSWTTNTNYSMSVAPMINSSGRTHYIGRLDTTYSEDYRARNCFVDNGTALTPSSFGYQNTSINEWVSKSQSAVKAVVDAGGTNSFMLDFDDGASLTTLGYDKSSKGNNWTLNNISLTAGSTYDWMLDVPGNSYCTASPIDLGANPASSTLSEANLKSACAAVAGGSSTCGTQALPAGKWYWEYVPTAVGNGLVLGITSRTSGAPSGTVVGYTFDGTKNVGGTGSAYGASYAANDVIGVAVDTTANTIEFFKNNTSQGVITNATYVVPGCKPVHWNNSSSGSSTVQHMYGQAPLHASATYHSAAGGYFRYTPPTGFKALCQANLPDQAILNPEKHFDIRTRTGDGTSPKVLMSDLLFAPELVWTKDRNTGYQHIIQDIVRGTGASKKLYSSLTEAEGGANSVYGYISSFDANGVTATVGASGFQHINANAVTYVDWLWKMGGAAVTNNNGSISSQVSANVLAGQSVVTYTGDFTAGATVGHGLNSAPELVIIKNRDAVYDWPVFHTKGGSGNAGLLNLTNAFGASSYFNGVAPGATTFALGAQNQSNQNASKHVALCAHSVPGYSKIGSYTGNGSADGPYVECGFKPKYVLIKRTDSTGSWQVFDSIRAGYNVDNDQLVANTSAAEVTTDLLDLTANGFKLRSTSTEVNASGGTYIFYAVADVPGKYSLAR